MKYTIETKGNSYLQTLELDNGEKYHRRYIIVGQGYKSTIDESFSNQLREKGYTDKSLFRSLDLFDSGNVSMFINIDKRINKNSNRKLIEKDSIKNILWNQKYSDTECLEKIAELVGIHKK